MRYSAVFFVGVHSFFIKKEFLPARLAKEITDSLTTYELITPKTEGGRATMWHYDSESGIFRPPNEPINEKMVLESLTKTEVLERFLHRIFPGKFRFSIEGVDTLIPMFNEIVGLAAESDIYHIMIGMAHRGRLNVMHHVMNKP